MIGSTRPVLALVLAAALGGCATTADRYGSSTVGVGLFAFCEPTGWTIDWPPADAADLRAPERRDLEPRVATLPELRSLRGVLEINGGPREVPDLLAPQRPDLPARRTDPLIELLPTRGAPWLPATMLDVPMLPARERPDLGTRPAQPVPDLGAPMRYVDLAIGSVPTTDESRACDRAPVLASTSCRLPARADLRDPARRSP